MIHKSYNTRGFALLLTSVLIAASTLADPPRKQNRPASIDAFTESGTITGVRGEHEGITVVEVWGNSSQAGFAQGYLLAEEILKLVDGFVFHEKIMPNPAIYERMLKPTVYNQFKWTPEQMLELRGIFAGMRDRLGTERLRSERLDRPLDFEDLLATNATADWFGLFCSSLTVWGPRTADGHPLTARNLDFPYTRALQKGQIIVVRRHEAPRRSWISITWPGCVGLYTAMNDQGITMLMHDANNLPATQVDGFTPRALMLREALELAEGADFVDDIYKSFQAHRSIMGNNVHVSGPRSKTHPCAAVFEFDANKHGDGVTLRTHADEPRAEFALWCTNHMRKRIEPTQCDRYTLLERALASKQQHDPESLLNLIREAKQSITLHSAVLEPHRCVLHAYIPAVVDKVVTFDFAAMLKQPRAKAIEGARGN